MSEFDFFVPMHVSLKFFFYPEMTRQQFYCYGDCISILHLSDCTDHRSSVSSGVELSAKCTQ